MAVEVRFAPHFEEVSLSLGATPDNMKSAQSNVELALAGRSDLVNVMDIRITMTNPHFRHWQRVKVLKSGIRTIFEAWQDDNNNVIVLVHAAAPRQSDTYEDIEKLWKQYRTRITP
jgi:hypothetical protein